MPNLGAFMCFQKLEIESTTIEMMPGLEKSSPHVSFHRYFLCHSGYRYIYILTYTLCIKIFTYKYIYIYNYLYVYIYKYMHMQYKFDI